MAADIPTKEPIEFRAGDSVSWTKSLANYSAATDTLTYRLRGPQSLDITCTQSGTDFAAEITAAQTAQLQPGDYWIVGTVVSGSDTKTIYAANIRVLPNFSDAQQVADGYDGRTHARKMLDAIESALTDDAGKFIVEYNISGQRMIRRYSAEEKQKEWSFWAGIVQQEEKAEAIARGENRNIYIRRREPR